MKDAKNLPPTPCTDGIREHHVRFELWLMGQNAEDQRNYWELLKDAKWNKGRSVMPRYSVLEVVLVEAPDFNDLDTLSAEIINRGISVTEEIQDFIKRIE